MASVFSSSQTNTYLGLRATKLASRFAWLVLSAAASGSVSASTEPRHMSADPWQITVFDPCSKTQIKNCSEVSVVVINQKTGSMETLRAIREDSSKLNSKEFPLEQSAFYYRFNSPLMGEQIISPSLKGPRLIELKDGSPANVLSGRWIRR